MSTGKPPRSGGCSESLQPGLSPFWAQLPSQSFSKLSTGLPWCWVSTLLPQLPWQLGRIRKPGREAASSLGWQFTCSRGSRQLAVYGSWGQQRSRVDQLPSKGWSVGKVELWHVGQGQVWAVPEETELARCGRRQDPPTPNPVPVARCSGASDGESGPGGSGDPTAMTEPEPSGGAYPHEDVCIISRWFYPSPLQTHGSWNYHQNDKRWLPFLARARQRGH